MAGVLRPAPAAVAQLVVHDDVPRGAWVGAIHDLEAHRHAALSVLRVVIAFVAARLVCQYSLQFECAPRLRWLIDSTECLIQAADGDPEWSRPRLRRRLARLDASLGPGSLWEASWKQRGFEVLGRGAQGAVELSGLLEVYDSAFEEQCRAWDGAVDRAVDAPQPQVAR